jgi:hypothetical protein
MPACDPSYVIAATGACVPPFARISLETLDFYLHGTAIKCLTDKSF